MREYDKVITTIADYLLEGPTATNEAYQTARLALADALGCAILALKHPECTRMLGPVVPGTEVPFGARVPGTTFILDPIRAAFNIGTLIRWLDYNDTWLAAEWGHPSDNLGGLLSVTDYLSQYKTANGEPPFTVEELLTAMIQAYEIQGVLALSNSFNQVGLDHVILVKVATAGVVSKLLGGNREQICAVLSNAWIDLGPLRTYRHAPNTGSRKSWAAGDATSRGVQLAWIVQQGEMGYPTALSASNWGLQETVLKGTSLALERPLGSYVIENILFKILFPAEFHAQTAAEAALQLHPLVKDKLEQIESIEIYTQEAAIRIIDKKGPLSNVADRDHCLQYIVAVMLIYGELTSEHYKSPIANDARIHQLRNKMSVHENKEHSKNYLHPEKRSIANTIVIHFQDGITIGPLEVSYPLGHKQRRTEALPFIFEKFRSNLITHFPEESVKHILELFQDHNKLCRLPVPAFVSYFL